jgi:tRNA uridine 5-carboxymethylaminomethyl modification enzyme
VNWRPLHGARCSGLAGSLYLTVVMTMQERTETFDVIVIGAGHAGCEAALAAARVGCKTLIVTPNLDRIGFMPCNPSIGGPAKGHLVRDVDALGGEMGRAIDRTALQIRLLNTSKGPAVQSLRAQADKALYQLSMKESLETQDNVTVRQELVTDVVLEPIGNASGVRVSAITTEHGNRYLAGAVVVTAGTFLRGSMIAGTWSASGGRAGDVSATALSSSLTEVGMNLRRLKTGTPPRIDARTVDFSKMELQHGSDRPLWFSHDGLHGRLQRIELPPLPIYPGLSLDGWRNQMPCYLVETNPEAHEIIAANIDRAPMYNGAIQSTGPRYCPSIEDKVVRFPDKTAHGLFLEPEGWRTTELYLQGANTSLPQDVQDAFLRTIPGLENVSITRYGYAVEYDAIDASELHVTMESKKVRGLFLAGQVCGTSGYEEAAGQGLVAGINAAAHATGGEPLILRRDQSYIGVMIDDLTTQDFIEPYRMLTSRAEYRLLLRSDNAEARLTEVGYRYGLIPEARRAQVADELSTIESRMQALDKHYLSPNKRTGEMLESVDLPPVTKSVTALEYLRRTDVHYGRLATALNTSGISIDSIGDWTLPDHLAERTEIEARYAAYIEKEIAMVERARKLEDRRIPADVDFRSLPSLRNEARDKLDRLRPATLGQASRIAGVTPGDVAVLMVYLERAGGELAGQRKDNS